MQPGFRVLSSSGPVRPFGRNPFLRCQSYSPLPIVRAFDSSASTPKGRLYEHSMLGAHVLPHLTAPHVFAGIPGSVAPASGLVQNGFRLSLSVAPPFGLECLTSLADSTAYYALC